MHRCFELAICGLGNVSPNPLVGCVIVYQDEIIGEGYHRKCGEAHAEVNAIQSVKNPELLSESTLYVNLEPCSHHGKTPPCTDLIIEKGMKKVVISNTDPFPAVNGSGIQKLRDAGIEVITSVFQHEGARLNSRFFTFHKKKRPYIILKWARTLDGYIDVDRQRPDYSHDNWITNNQLKSLVHKWRSEEDAVMIGTNTAINDNPQLNVREWSGRNPVRLVLDRTLRLPENLHIADQQIPTIVFTSVEKESKPNLIFHKIDFSQPVLNQIHSFLYHQNIQSVIVEGGKILLDSYLESGLWDEARVLEGNKIFGSGLKGPDIRGCLSSTSMFAEDRLIRYFNL